MVTIGLGGWWLVGLTFFPAVLLAQAQKFGAFVYVTFFIWVL